MYVSPGQRERLTEVVLRTHEPAFADAERSPRRDTASQRLHESGLAGTFVPLSQSIRPTPEGDPR